MMNDDQLYHLEYLIINDSGKGDMMTIVKILMSARSVISGLRLQNRRPPNLKTPVLPNLDAELPNGS
jgi:hypothetical protein